MSDPSRLSSIHPSAIIAPNAQIGENVEIGPWCVVGANAVLEENVKLHANVIIDGHTILRQGVEVFPFVTIGMAPQDLKYGGEPTSCEIGERTIIRENVTIHRGTTQGISSTKVGAHCLIMANSHIAHDCVIGDGVIIVNNVVMGGHVEIGDGARIMGSAAMHQFVRIGRGALVGGLCGVEADVIPYGCVLGNRARLVGLHWIWLKRQGVSHPEMKQMRQAYLDLYPRYLDASRASSKPGSDADADVFASRLAQVKKNYEKNSRVKEIIDFMEAKSRRGLVKVSGLRRREGEPFQD